MKWITGMRSAGLATAIVGLALLAAGTASAASGGPVTKTFSFIGRANSKTTTLLNIDKLTINARCNGQGEPVIYAFSASSNADLFGRYFDGYGRLHVVKDSSFVKGQPGLLLSATNGDFDATGTVLFETYGSQSVTVNYAFDNATTLAKRNVCTVYGSAIAS